MQRLPKLVLTNILLFCESRELRSLKTTGKYLWKIIVDNDLLRQRSVYYINSIDVQLIMFCDYTYPKEVQITHKNVCTAITYGYDFTPKFRLCEVIHDNQNLQLEALKSILQTKNTRLLKELLSLFDRIITQNTDIYKDIITENSKKLFIVLMDHTFGKQKFDNQVIAERVRSCIKTFVCLIAKHASPKLLHILQEYTKVHGWYDDFVLDVEVQTFPHNRLWVKYLFRGGYYKTSVILYFVLRSGSLSLVEKVFKYANPEQRKELVNVVKNNGVYESCIKNCLTCFIPIIHKYTKVNLNPSLYTLAIQLDNIMALELLYNLKCPVPLDLILMCIIKRGYFYITWLMTLFHELSAIHVFKLIMQHYKSQYSVFTDECFLSKNSMVVNGEHFLSHLRVHITSIPLTVWKRYIFDYKLQEKYCAELKKIMTTIYNKVEQTLNTTKTSENIMVIYEKENYEHCCGKNIKKVFVYFEEQLV